MKSEYEKNILPFINDFDTFINFICEKDPNLSNTKQVLGKSDCFALNSQLHFQKSVTKASSNQDQYEAIDLFFSLAVKSKLFLIIINNKNKFKLVKTSRLEEYLNLNIYEKYVFLLEYFWTNYKFEEELKNDIIAFGKLIYVISRSKPENKILKENVSSVNPLFSYYSKITKILRILGLCELETIDNIKNRYNDCIRSIIPTKFGIEICKILINKALDYLNSEYFYIDMIREICKIKDIDVEETFFEIISQVFEQELIQKSIDTDIQVNRKGTYILKISLDNNLWRVVRLSHKTKLHKLHLVIQKAFEFDNDHMYAFYKGASYRNGEEFYSANPFGESEEYEDLTIEDAELYKGQQFIYLFDFGDMWEFKIQVMDFIENEEICVLPEIIQSEGKSPDQYADWN